jgi:peptidoglycan/xylan/chitin deacetylase (PgdA/CDA1 family)
MLTFRNTSTVFLLSLLTLNLLNVFIGISGWWYALPLGLYSVVIMWGSSKVDSNFHFKVYCKGETDEKLVALTFDDGPDPELTPQVLDVLNKHGVTAAFFCIGKKMDAAPELTKRIIDEGHVLGTHTYTHGNWFDMYAPWTMRKDIMRAADAAYNATGKRPLLFRPPYGVTNPNLRLALRKTPFLSVGWSIRTLDTVKSDHDKIASRMNNLHPGDIILLHDTTKGIAKLLDDSIVNIKISGFKIVRADTLLNIKAYENNES